MFEYQKTKIKCILFRGVDSELQSLRFEGDSDSGYIDLLLVCTLFVCFIWTEIIFAQSSWLLFNFSYSEYFACTPLYTVVHLLLEEFRFSLHSSWNTRNRYIHYTMTAWSRSRSFTKNKGLRIFDFVISVRMKINYPAHQRTGRKRILFYRLSPVWFVC